jgi:thiosulfate/3-mercaptopyruvate sulfurtransferase
MKILFTPTELAETLTTDSLVPIRALMDDPVSKAADTRSHFVIPNSVDFDLDEEGSDHNAHYPHTLPSIEALSAYLARSGITPNSRVVVYDTRGMYCAPRVWWMLNALGHNHAAILNGGQPAWEKEGFPIAEKRPTINARYNANFRNGWFVDADYVFSSLKTTTQIIDARSAARFNGEVPEPRVGLRSGHMPGAINIPYQQLIQDGAFLEKAALAQVFIDAGVDLTLPIVCTCGSGITACIIGVAARLCGAKNVVVYDGSWSEWGAVSHYPVTR